MERTLEMHTTFESRLYRGGYLWNRKLWRMSADSIQAFTCIPSIEIDSS